MNLQFINNTRSVVAEAFAALFEPPDQVTPSQWASKNLKVPDGPRAGDFWDASFTPYIVEPLDNMGPESAVNKQSIKKSAQTGFSLMAIAGVGHSIDCDPAGGILLVQPTDGALADFIRDKLTPAIEDSPSLKSKVKPQVSRSGEGSTTYNKRYPGGSLALAIANSTADLRSKTKKRIIKDEASEYPADLDGQGSPHTMIEARYESFRATGDWKETNISTPTIAGACYIDEQYRAGDQRRWHVPCPGCGEGFAFRFGPNFRYEETYPHKPHYVTPCCGTVIEPHQKANLVRRGRWIAEAPGPGKHRSYHFDTLSSPMVPWDVVVERWIAAQSDPAKLKAFYNLTLGEAYEIKGDAPDHERLMERREDYPKGRIPARGLMLTGFADVQMRGIWVEVVAWAPNRESWVVWADYLDGDTTNHRRGAFLKLAELYEKQWPDTFGGRRRIDAFGVDSGFRTHVVYAWCAERTDAYATKGMDGWSKPAMGLPSPQDIDLQGRKIAQGVKLWPIGTWSLKAHWYEDLRKDGRAAGREVDPPGYCHFGTWLDDTYFKQVTAEYLAEKRSPSRGRVTKAWAIRGNEDNHLLDCRVGNMALADHLGLSRMTDDEWRLLARDRAGPLLAQGDLFAPAPLNVQASTPLPLSSAGPSAPSPSAFEAGNEVADVPAMPIPSNRPAPAPVERPAPAIQPGQTPEGREVERDDWIGRSTGGWFDR